MSCDCNNNCCGGDCCPEVVAVTVNNNDFVLSENSLDITVADLSPVDPTSKQVTVQVVDEDAAAVAGNFRVNLWFVDSPLLLGEVSTPAPAQPGWEETTKVTDANGQIQFDVTHAGALTTWYLAGSLGAGVEISAALTIGV